MRSALALQVWQMEAVEFWKFYQRSLHMWRWLRNKHDFIVTFILNTSELQAVLPVDSVLVSYVLGMFVIHDGEEFVDWQHLWQWLGVEQFLGSLLRDGVRQSPIRVVGHHQVANILHRLLVSWIYLLSAEVSAATEKRQKKQQWGRKEAIYREHLDAEICCSVADLVAKRVGNHYWSIVFVLVSLYHLSSMCV